MKYLKKYENIEYNSIEELKKLIEHIKNMFSEMNLMCSLRYYEYNYIKGYKLICKTEKGFINDEGFGVFPDLFEIEVNTTHSGYLSIKRNIDDNSLADFIVPYFKTIDGLSIMEDYNTFIGFKIIDNIDTIIKRIYIDDFNLKYDVKKFNI